VILHLDYLRSFGPYRNFVGNEASGVPAFNKFNLFYGWNYSGKTTLSRAFQVLEHPAKLRDYATASFKFTLDDGSELSSANLSNVPAVRVFNRDYVNENFQQEHAAPAVFIVGKENADLKKRLALLHARRTRVESIANNLGSKKAAIESQANKDGRDAARNIRDLIGDARFERPQLDRRIAEVRHNTTVYILNDDIVQSRLATLHSTESYTEQPKVTTIPPDLTALSSKVNALLGQTAANRAIERLKRDASLESWVRQGLALNSDSETCGFCGSPLKREQLEALRGHFSEAYEGLLRGLEQNIQQLKGSAFVVPLPHERELMPDLRQELVALKKRLEGWRVWAETTRDQLVAMLEQKKTAVETISNWSGDLSRADEIQNIVLELNGVFVRHNELVSGLDKAKVDAKFSLERHYAARYFVDNQITLRESEAEQLQAQINRSRQVEAKIRQVIRNIENQISQTAIGATKLNELLRYLLAGSNIEVESVGESEFQFKRGGEVATNLSDGEKTAVTFAYFLTSLEGNGASPDSTIVFVDDPISSLDSNHIYAVYALITARLENCHQLFVSTHNSEFFNLLKGRWLNERSKVMRRSTSAYYVARITNAEGVSHSQVSNLPKLLRKYKSEYEFVFAHLQTFSLAVAPTEHEAYTSPNLLRKFLEAYLGFRKPSVSAWHEKLDLLFDSAEQQREIHKFADDASHLQSLNRSLQQPAFVSSAQRVVGDVLNALRDKDPSHHASLLEVFNEANQ